MHMAMTDEEKYHNVPAEYVKHYNIFEIIGPQHLNDATSNPLVPKEIKDVPVKKGKENYNNSLSSYVSDWMAPMEWQEYWPKWGKMAGYSELPDLA